MDVRIRSESGEEVSSTVTDNEDGTYSIEFTPNSRGPHRLEVNILHRPIKESPLCVEVQESNPPVASLGSRGVGDLGFVQPCSVCQVGEEVYVVDTGNSRLKVLSSSLQFRRHLLNPGLQGRSVTGLCPGAAGQTLLIVNWRSRTVTEMTLEGVTVNSFTHTDLVEPIAVAVNKEGEVYVADNGAAAVLVFSPAGKLLRRITVRKAESGKRVEFMSFISVGGRRIRRP